MTSAGTYNKGDATWNSWDHQTSFVLSSFISVINTRYKKTSKDAEKVYDLNFFGFKYFDIKNILVRNQTESVSVRI